MQFMENRGLDCGEYGVGDLVYRRGIVVIYGFQRFRKIIESVWGLLGMFCYGFNCDFYKDSLFFFF